METEITFLHPAVYTERKLKRSDICSPLVRHFEKRGGTPLHLICVCAALMLYGTKSRVLFASWKK
ncbi:hypothetical protein BaRGS_00040531, partial [Batillaria attramentaria]